MPEVTRRSAEEGRSHREGEGVLAQSVQRMHGRGRRVRAGAAALAVLHGNRDLRLAVLSLT